MWRFLGTLASIVAVVWLLSYFAAPTLPDVEGRDITPPEPLARIAEPLVEASGDAAAPHDAPPPTKEAEPAKEKDVEKKSEGSAKKIGKGDGKRRPLTSGLFAS